MLGDFFDLAGLLGLRATCSALRWCRFVAGAVPCAVRREWGGAARHQHADYYRGLGRAPVPGAVCAVDPGPDETPEVWFHFWVAQKWASIFVWGCEHAAPFVSKWAWAQGLSLPQLCGDARPLEMRILRLGLDEACARADTKLAEWVRSRGLGVEELRTEPHALGVACESKDGWRAAALWMWASFGLTPADALAAFRHICGLRQS